jgi:hypothetical protein
LLALEPIDALHQQEDDESDDEEIDDIIDERPVNDNRNAFALHLCEGHR